MVKKSKKKFFEYNDQIVYACGILWLKNKNIYKEFLVQEVNLNKNIRYSDFGGSIEGEDEDIYDTASREFCEETNMAMKRKDNYLSKEEIEEILKDPKYLIEKIYFKNSKYLLFVVNLPKNCKIDLKKCGNFEETDKIERKVMWMNINEFSRNFGEGNIHPRLWSLYFSNFIDDQIGKKEEKIIKKFAFTSEL